MQLVSWVALLTLLVRDLAGMRTLDVAATVRKDRLHPRQAKLLETLSEYEIASPVRVDAGGEPLPTDVHFKRRRRSVDSASDPGPASASSSSTSSQEHYRLSAFGQHFLFNLTAQAGFIAPLFTVTLLGAPGVNQTKLYSEEETELKHCFYAGHVNTETAHTAVLSLCSGMLGTFRSHDGDYFIEPLLSMDEQEKEEEQNKPHIIYRRSLPQQEPSAGKHACGTSEHRSSHGRDRRKSSRRKWGGASRLAEDVAALQHGLAAKLPATLENQTSAPRDPRTRRRTKRFLSYPRFVEVMVVVDNKMVLYHGANLQHYVLTLMAIVASLYKDPSIGNLINIVIVNLVVIHDEQEGPPISFNAQTTLKNFCQWQHSQNSPGGIRHDTAVLITRQDICRAHDKCDTLGLAELGTICDPYRSCSISEDSGLSTAFTIAHELGHVFNMPHDDSNKCREEGVKSTQHVMAPTLTVDTNPWLWSKCSRKYITEFLDTGYGECLLNEPESRPYSLPPQLPGLFYSVNKQCEFIFGPGAELCPYMVQCRRLWCNVKRKDRACQTQHTPWADGTECEPGKHCKFGFCVPKEMEGPAVDGSWGSWSPYGACSRTCGGGIKMAIRECNRPEPKNGGKYCVGRRMKFKSCNMEPCLKQKRDFRDEQCAHFDGKHFNINGLLPTVRWVPKYSGILMKDRCKLFCRVAGSTAYYQLRDRVVDGTPCGQDTNDICVQGLCRQAGCDHVLNSKARRDKCGVCGGDNSSCKTVAGTFNTVHYGYNAVVRIPAGATNIDVRQHSFSGKSEDDNYLALSNSKGEFLLNGDFVVTMSKREIRVGNAMIEYSGSDNVVERINSTDRMDQELLLQVLSVGKLYNPDVRYSFNVPIEGRLQQFYWNSHGPWQACSKPCQGERKRKPVCTRESDQLPVSDQRCDRLPQPEPITEACSTDCDLRWHVGGRSECSAQCGLGYRTLDIYCAKYSRLDGKVEKVDDGFCSNHPKPTNQEKCSGECNMGVWRYSAWTECSKSCDGGSQRRRAICVNSRNDVLDDSKCAHQEKVTTQRCNELPCPQWKSGDWSECLVTCGKGRRHRQVWCQFGEDHASDKICNPEAKPASTQPCQQSECASWQAGPWGQCSVTCGQGYQLRAVKCVLGTYMAVLDDSDCNAATRPTDTQDCEAAPCQPPPAAPGSRRSSHGTPRTQWRFGSWTPCSATCGKGTRMRYVSCRGEDGSVAHEDACTSLPRPAASEECAVTPCGQWKASDWSVCSVTCGQGRATRQVVCVNYSDHVVSQSECDLDYIPETHQDCSLSPCPRWTPDRGLASYPFQNEDFRPRGASPSRTHVLGGNQWRTGPWGACSSTCAGGSQRRVVVCQDENGYPARDCVERIKPDEQRACEAGPCPQWVFGSWGECSKPCGGGVRTRLVLCQRASGERFPDLSCDVLEKPLDREQCGAHSCPDGAWSAGPWSPCSVSCGRGHKQRNVYCMAKDGSHLESDFCEHLAKPHGHRRCRGGRCPRWKAGAWSQCSVSCGRGVQQRHVACHIGTQKAARESECNSVSRPEAERDCQAPPCPLRTWRAEQWQECSKTCGEGSRFRRVVCVDEDQGELHSALCSTSQRPPDRESCSLQPCEYVWITGEWSECSVTCGKGYKQRLVSCSEIYTGKENYEYSYQTTVHCPGTQPPSVQPCYLQECPVLATWRVGNWGSCSVSCGVGEMHRSVQCLTNEDQPSHLCPADLKPEEQKTCHSAYNCEVPQNCKEVRDLSGASEDGEYVLIVRGKLLKIFCAGMQSSHPKEYVSLIHGDSENFSEVYGHRLHNPTECPYNGSRRDDCRCRKDYTAAGLSSFQKIRIDLGSMQIITTDLQFARTSEGHPVPFATAGDCYSAAKCPQGRFSINLDGTGLSVTESARWISQGNYAVSDIKRAPDGTRVVGKCGGYCGKCTPSSGTGLEVRVL